ncbi:MAG: MTAP family purine nucleoside phosphorylase [Candidatus Micrarchaeia archaeon]|jgi:5'-methylthioadenosine phosphorylase
MLGVISGSGLYNMGKMRERHVNTPYGRASLYSLKLGDEDVLFIPRHRTDHSIPAHKVNYKANIWALEEEGATAILAFYTAGIISKYKPGDIVLLQDFIGLFTPISLYDSFESGIRHADVSVPFDKKLCNVVREGAYASRVQLRKGGIIATTRGPRFETAAEIRVLKQMGANLVNMTAAYEVTLANELEVPIAGVAIGTNNACGIRGTRALSHTEVTKAVKKKEAQVKSIAAYVAEEVL